jgi:hypothetical protein
MFKNCFFIFLLQHIITVIKYPLVKKFKNSFLTSYSACDALRFSMEYLTLIEAKPSSRQFDICSVGMGWPKLQLVVVLHHDNMSYFLGTYCSVSILAGLTIRHLGANYHVVRTFSGRKIQGT